MTPRWTTAHLLKDPTDWDSNDLHNYVLSQMDHGQAEETKNASFIFKHFLKRWPNGVGIAKYAFDISKGQWHGKYVSPGMFQKGYDPYFAEEISQILER
jgi:hypothetical protein